MVVTCVRFGIQPTHKSVHDVFMFGLHGLGHCRETSGSVCSMLLSRISGSRCWLGHRRETSGGVCALAPKHGGGVTCYLSMSRILACWFRM